MAPQPPLLLGCAARDLGVAAKIAKPFSELAPLAALDENPFNSSALAHQNEPLQQGAPEDYFRAA
jgi:hypothetical protein